MSVDKSISVSESQMAAILRAAAPLRRQDVGGLHANGRRDASRAPDDWRWRCVSSSRGSPAQVLRPARIWGPDWPAEIRPVGCDGLLDRGPASAPPHLAGLAHACTAEFHCLRAEDS